MGGYSTDALPSSFPALAEEVPLAFSNLIVVETYGEKGEQRANTFWLLSTPPTTVEFAVPTWSIVGRLETENEYGGNLLLPALDSNLELILTLAGYVAI